MAPGQKLQNLLLEVDHYLRGRFGAKSEIGWGFNMTALLICEGFDISGYSIPKFEIPKNSFCQIKMPFTMESEADSDLLSILLGEKDHPSIKLVKSQPLYSGKMNRHREGILGVLKSNKLVNKLNRFFGLNREEIANILNSLNIEVYSHWDRIPHFERCLLSFEVSLACSSFVFFDTAGLDPIGFNKMHNHAKDKTKKGYTVVQLLYPTVSEDDLKDEFITFI
jgi:hypothetical protein